MTRAALPPMLLALPAHADDGGVDLTGGMAGLIAFVAVMSILVFIGSRR